MYELIYTSVPRGLLLGRSGFCPVAWTQGMPANFIPLLDRMDNYIHQLPEQSFAADESGLCYSCRHCRFGRRSIMLVSRIAPSGLDFQGKNNKIAHHFIFPDEHEYAALPDGGISVCLAEENFLSRWEQNPGLLPPFSPQTRSLNSNFAQQWQSITGDAGWAGVIGEFFLRGLSPGFYVEYPPGTPAKILLELIAEISRLLPRSRLPEFTFSTYFIQTPVNWDCFLRFCQSESPLLQTLRHTQAKHLLSFTEPQAVPAEWQDWDLVRQARYGLPPRELQMVAERAPTEVDGTKAVVPVIPEEDYDQSSWTLKKSDETLPIFVTPAGQNAAAVKAGRYKALLVLAGTLIIVLLSGLSYFAFSLLSLEKELEAASCIAVETAMRETGHDEPAVQPESAVEVPGVPVFQISEEEHWRMYQAWRAKAELLVLPAALAAADQVRIELKSIGGLTESLPDGWLQPSLLSSDGGRILQVLPWRRVDLPEGGSRWEVHAGALSAQRLTVSIPDLQILFPSGGAADLVVASHQDLLALEFQLNKEVWRWSPEFRQGFLAFLQRGRFTNRDWVLSYQISGDEQEYGQFLVICAGSLPLKEILRLPLADWLKQWNSVVLRRGELEQQLGLLRLRAAEEIRRHYPRLRQRRVTDAQWPQFLTGVETLINGQPQTEQGRDPGELQPELLQSLEEILLVQFTRVYNVFFLKNPGKSVAELKKEWWAEHAVIRQIFQNAEAIFKNARPSSLPEGFLPLRELMLQLPSYFRIMEEHALQEAALNKDIFGLETEKKSVSASLFDLAGQTRTSDFWGPYLNSGLEIPFQETLCQNFAELLDRRIEYHRSPPAGSSPP